MLTTLHVKNLAIIDEVEVNFSDNLNILTGETGAGKSIIIGSINIALGEKASKDLIRTGKDFALIDLIFTVDNDNVVNYLKEKDISIEGNEIIISRKIMTNKSICKINGEVVPIAILRDIAKYLLDIHGQNEHQSLLYKNNHLKILDKFCGDKTLTLREKIKMEYQEYIKLKKELEEAESNSGDKARETSLLEYQKNEIEEVEYKDGEDETLTKRYKELNSMEKISLSLGAAYNLIEENEDSNISSLISQLTKEIRGIAGVNDKLDGICEQIQTIEDLVRGLSSDIYDYLNNMDGSPEELDEITKRLNIIHNVQVKYGETYQDIMNFYNGICEKLDRYANLDKYIDNHKKAIMELEKKLSIDCENLTKLRTELSVILSDEITRALVDLNFLDVNFKINISPLEHYTDNGLDEVEFMISTNPGEPIRPLAKIASGGEMSRIMLAIKSVLADHDEIHTLIFDEIDTGISGRTAQKVSEKLSTIAKNHQVICITHLPQIAAMADSNFVIIKKTDNTSTNTSIEQIYGDDIITEISRMLGGAKITDTVRQNAKEMIELAKKI